MPEMKDSGIEWIGEIPTEWKISRIGSIYSVRNQKVSDRDYMPLSVTKNGIVPQLENAAKTNAHDDRKLVKKGDFAINSRSDRRGSCGISNYNGSVSLINTVLSPLDTMSPKYYDWLFHTPLFADEFYAHGHGIVDDLWTTTWNEMKNISIPVPSIEKQNEIASFLDTKCSEIDALRTDIEEQIRLLEEYKKSVITEAVTKGLDPEVEIESTDHPFITYKPKHWSFIKVGYLFKENAKPATGSEQSLSLSQVDGLVKTEEMVEHAMKSKSYAGWKKVKVDNLILNRFKAHLGVFFRSQYDGMVSFHYGVYEKKIDVNVKFFEYLFHSKPYCEMYAILSNGITVGLQNLGNASFYSGKCALPNRDEQNKIVKYLDEKCSHINKMIIDKKQQLSLLEDYKKSLIYEYVTGKKEVPADFTGGES